NRRKKSSLARPNRSMSAHPSAPPRVPQTARMMMLSSACRLLRSRRGSVRLTKNGAKSSKVAGVGIHDLRDRVPTSGASFAAPLTKSIRPPNNQAAFDAIALGCHRSLRSHRMSRSLCLLSASLAVGACVTASAQDKNPGVFRARPEGVYAVLRDGAKEGDVLPLKDGEALAVDRHRYQKSADGEPPRFLVVRPVPDVKLALAGEPKAVREGEQVVSILVK